MQQPRKDSIMSGAEITGAHGASGDLRIPAARPAALPRLEIHAVADKLADAGLATAVRESRAGLDLTATVRDPGQHEAEVVLDEDGYAEIRWWTDPAGTPGQLTAIIAAALALVTDGGYKNPTAKPQP